MRGQLRGRIGLQRGELALEHLAAGVVLVAQVDVDVLDAHGPRGDQHALEEAVRVALEVVAVLERARLALVDVDRHEPRARLGAHDASTCAPTGKPAPPRPRRPESSIVLMTASTSRLPVDALEPGLVAALRAYVGVVDAAAVAGALVALRVARTASTPSAVAWPKAFWPTHTAGASAQRPMHGAAITRTFGPSERRQLVEQLLRAGHRGTRASRTRAP